MNIVIVENRDGKRRIRWPQYLSLSFALAMIMGYGSGLGLRLLSGRWSHEAVLLGIFMGVGIVAVGLIKGLRVPANKPARQD